MPIVAVTGAIRPTASRSPRLTLPARPPRSTSTSTTKAKPGLRGNLIVTITGERVPAANAQQPRPSRQHVPLGVLPAIPFEVAPPVTAPAPSFHD